MSSVDILLLMKYSTYLTNLSNYACEVRAINGNFSQKYREESSHKIIKKNKNVKYINVKRCSIFSTKALCKCISYQKASHDGLHGRIGKQKYR